MRELTSLDQRILSYKIEKIFPVIADFETYKEWFPSKPGIKIIKTTAVKTGSIIQVQFGIIKFTIELMRINPNKEIIVHYSGAYRGKGIWYFFESANGTKLMYEIELEILNPLIRFSSLFLNIASLHSKMMTKIFDGLENYLHKIYKNEANGINNSDNTQPKIFSISGN